MDDFLRTLAEHRGGYILRPDLLDSGVSDRQIRAAVREGVLERIRVGTYAPRGHESLPERERYRLLCHAVQDRLPSGVVLTHHSAAAIHTGIVYGFDLNQVHVTHPNGTIGRAEAGIVHHGGALRDGDVTEIDGHRLVVPARAALESAALAGVEAGMVQISEVMRRGTTGEEINDRLARMAQWPGISKVRLAVHWSSPELESVGETRSMYMFRTGGLPVPRLQVHLHDVDGSIGRVDFEWEDYWHCGEFDGLVKYGRLNPYSGANLGQVVVDEKVREDRIRALPRGMSRWIFADLNRPVQTCARIRAALEQSRRLYGRNPRTVVI